MISVWRVRLDAVQVLTSERLSWLNAAERERAARFRFPRDAQRWRVAHVALRALLGDALGRTPSAVDLRADAKGKPRVYGGPEFNLSHSADVGLIAVGGAAPLGVDVELVRSVPEMRRVAESHFAPEERRALYAAAERDRTEAFYRCWTRKEAFVKATGIGVGPALARFAVTLGRESVQLLRADDDEADAWSLVDLDLGLPYIGALAVREPQARVVLRDWAA